MLGNRTGTRESKGRNLTGKLAFVRVRGDIINE